jgi:hypothetical protein
MSLFRAEKLIDLACSTTHEEEARTAALAACRLIRKHGLRLSVDGQDEFASGRWTPARSPASRTARAAPEPPREKPPNGGTFGRATASRRCESCGGGIEIGDEIYVVSGVTWCRRH